MPTSKPAPLLWSPETDRTHSGTQASQAGLKKPAFNLSVFGTSALVSDGIRFWGSIEGVGFVGKRANLFECVWGFGSVGM